ncbi:UvrD-helicase domain-containing protein [Rhodococcoides fascians]|uniref:UvrD-helicase domain-containing protein n=1 Tax=Rhodococcoides fascians TaxID=1828 RepID=UPI001E12EB0A|nr:UvrD-helicase domain-containing protein [Rhodococcus fascians]CAH0230143.1 ATP-dependent DNA helicase PcrA [Rhodococcus fascians]
MKIVTGSNFDLTPSQLTVVEQPWDARTLVTAGAGSGKTTSLTYRLEYLTGNEELEAGEILVLSFSRAAVRELRNRVDRLAVNARRVRAQTFDGWALALLRQMDPSRDDLIGTSFDERVARAISAIDDGVVESFELGAPAHVVIDEVQDLVGVRREMVEALLGRFSDSCGFTVVGDAAQSIYGFQVADAEHRASETNRFFDWIRASYPDDLKEVVLDSNFRARTTEARVALRFGAQLQALPTDTVAANAAATAIYADLCGELAAAPLFGDLKDPFVQDSLSVNGCTTAILCRDNGQVLWLSDKLHGYGVPHRIQRSPLSRPVPTWIADLLQAGGATITESRFSEIVSGQSSVIDEPDRVWRSLRRVASTPRNQLNIETLRKVVAEGRLPDELTANPVHSLVLSTAHRAKGLEFDRVLVCTPEPLISRRGRDIDPPAEARLLYVAMTRPRDDLYRMTIPKLWHIHRAVHNQYPVDRWFLGGRQPWARNGIEALDFDVCHAVPAGVREPISDPIDTQRYLRESVQIGDAMELRRLHDLPESDTETPPYGVFHDGRPVGEASARFRSDLWRLLKLNRGYEVRRWPKRIIGLRVDSLETVVGSAAVSERSGIGGGGVWIAPRLCGLGKFEWNDTTAESGISE